MEGEEQVSCTRNTNYLVEKKELVAAQVNKKRELVGRENRLAIGAS